jgi:hypothetical protein
VIEASYSPDEGGLAMSISLPKPIADYFAAEETGKLRGELIERLQQLLMTFHPGKPGNRSKARSGRIGATQCARLATAAPDTPRRGSIARSGSS